MKGRYQKPNTRNWKKTVLVILAVIIGLLAALIIGVVIYYNLMLNKMNQVKVPTIEYTEEVTETTQPPVTEMSETTEAPTETTEPHVASSADYINFLVVGQAAREGEPEFFADTMLLFTLNTYEKTLTQTSILRDSFVQYPNYTDTAGRAHHGGRIKLTTIYHMGYLCTNSKADAMGLMNLTLYKNFGIEVDHNFEIDFDGFVEIINMLGGIDIELTQAEADYLNVYIEYEGRIPDEEKYVVSEGMNHLEGYAALTYARLRKAEGDNESDVKRTGRQQKMVSILLDKIRGLSLSELQNLANKVLPLITTSMDNAQITEYLLNYLPMLPELKLQSGGTCPAESWGDLVDIYGDGVLHSVLHFDENATKKAIRAITEGEVE